MTPALVAALLGLLAALRLVPLDALLLAAPALAPALAAARPRRGEPQLSADELPDPLLTVDGEGIVGWANPTARRLLGAPLVGRPLGRYLPALQEPARLSELVSADHVELEAVHESGRPVPVEVRIATGRDGHVLRLLDAGARIRERARRAELAWQDPLAGLPNRRLLEDRAGQALVQAEHHRQPLAFMLLDLGRFKEVNDALGHRVGDLLLQQVAERLARPLRRSDTRARLGGDEFAVLFGAADRPR